MTWTRIEVGREDEVTEEITSSMMDVKCDKGTIIEIIDDIIGLIDDGFERNLLSLKKALREKGIPFYMVRGPDERIEL